PTAVVARSVARRANQRQRHNVSAPETLSEVSHRRELAMRGLPSVSPLATLDRGYAIVEDASSGKVLLKASDAVPGDDIRARLAEGELIATVTSTRQKND
ncbi:MAG: exodeoxyribonuclease VII large subunit, partial [Woeseiaceae bacterium]|nr:exodeoxyribonuclease VII large subunit [Woeseiaceae bacterium]MDX2608717.1 exodeoxyribonuclease VII large subunit [Woeseiaceae bacterium]